MAWERLAHSELTSTADLINSGTFTAKKNLKVVVYASGTDIETQLRFNSDNSANYASNRENDGGSESDFTSQTMSKINATGNGLATYTIAHIYNRQDEPKSAFVQQIAVDTAGAGTAPRRSQGCFKYQNTSAQITSIQVVNNGSGDFAAGSFITVFGAKEATTSDTITVDSLEAKKHLMIQAKLIASGNIEAAVRFNNDSGNNYSTRYSVNGSESTGTSKNSIDTNLTAGGNEFVTYNVINEATKEKLVISELVDSNTSGAGTAPQRVEVVGKWANTSNAITRVDLVNVSTGDFAEGSEVTVYGTD